MCRLVSCSSVWEKGAVRSPSLCSGRRVFMVVAAVCSKPTVEEEDQEVGCRLSVHRHQRCCECPDSSRVEVLAVGI
jgi:hypothetical protein